MLLPLNTRSADGALMIAVSANGSNHPLHRLVPFVGLALPLQDSWELASRDIYRVLEKTA